MNNQIKSQVIEQIQKGNNVLVTVSANPTVDELSASIGLTLALNKMGKHATTVFSGVVPSTIEFLQPEKTIETTTDSLRDFIIALDKSKADKLRYKVEDDVVRIFITPYRSTITENDLEFSHGDFNVDVVIGLGVTRREDLDMAITSHGRILHDATVIAVTKQDNVSDIGAINWQEPQASSLCEMVAALAYELQADAIDGQMATAFLTGIIAETDRFKNQKTAPLTLSLSSQLLLSGANQQLIAEKLEEPAPAPAAIAEEHIDKVSVDGELSIDHRGDTEPEVNNEPIDNIQIDEHGNLSVDSNDQGVVQTETTPSVADQPAQDVSYNSAEQSDAPVDLFSELVASEEAEHSSVAPDEHQMSTLSHEKVIQPLQDSELPQKSDKPFDLQEALKESLPAEAAAITPSTEVSSTLPTPQMSTVDTVPMSPPVAANETAAPSDTLEQLEKAVDSPHLQAPANAALLQSAQQAVENIAAFNPQYPVPQEAIGSQPIDLGNELTQTNPVKEAPPPVPPPPMMPQFYDADGSNDDPFDATDQHK